MRFVGLELEPISTAIGFEHDQSGCFAGLLSVTDDEWEGALRAFAPWSIFVEAHNSGRQCKT